MSQTPFEVLQTMHAEISHVVSPVYLVGGCVRDACIGIKPHDFDGATPLLPQEVQDCVRAAGRRAYLVGKRFGTIGFKALGQHVEITTFRDERYQANSRKPDVSFVGDLITDLSRRDFTINALAYDGSLIDPFGGQSDLNNRILRCVGNPTERFCEDPLRMVRGARFAAQLNLSVERRTKSAMTTQAGQILTVPIERIMIEIDKLLNLQELKECTYGVALLHETHLLSYLMPELSAWNSERLTNSFERQVYHLAGVIDEYGCDRAVSSHLVSHAQKHLRKDLRLLALLTLIFGGVVDDCWMTEVGCSSNRNALQSMLNRHLDRWGRSLRISNDRIAVLQQYARLCDPFAWRIS